MDSLDAIEKVLQQAAEPLHYQEITKRILQQNLWQTDGKTPEATINARLSVDIKRLGTSSRFVRSAPGKFALRMWGLDESRLAESSHPSTNNDASEKYSFTDAAEFVLDHYADKQPMHYFAITDRIMELGLVNTQGKTPEATVYSMILTEIKRAEERSVTPRFVKYGEGIVGLRKWLGEGLAYQIDQQNRGVKKELLDLVQNLSAKEFENLVSRLLIKMGFVDVEVTKFSGDGGIDVRGTLVVGDVIRTKMAIQAKKWKYNVQAPVVQQVRGSLGTHEQGMIITTSNFSKGAEDEAARVDAIPVALMNGQQLVELLIEHQILVKRVPYELINIDADEAL